MSAEVKTKKVSRKRTVSAGSSPEPKGVSSDPACGHSSCGTMCNVRYVGPTSRIHDHFAMHAARGATHVWSAAIVTGLAVVLTGTLAYSSVEARIMKAQDGNGQAVVERMTQRLAQMESAMKELRELCSKASIASDNANTNVTENADLQTSNLSNEQSANAASSQKPNKRMLKSRR